MEFRFNAESKSVKVDCLKILIQEITLHKGNFEDISLFFCWQSMDKSHLNKVDFEHEIILETFQIARNPENSKHIKLLDRWPNGWHKFPKNLEGVVIRFQNRKNKDDLSGLDFTLVFETK